MLVILLMGFFSSVIYYELNFFGESIFYEHNKLGLPKYLLHLI